MIKPNAVESSTFIITVSFFDESNLPVEPETMSWTLRDAAGTIVNDREDVAIDTPIGSSTTILLSGDDLALTGYFSGLRTITLEGTYDSDLMTGAPISAATIFKIDPVIKAENTGDTLDTMLDRLSLYYNDPNMTKVVPQTRVRLLNEAVKKVIPQIARHRLPDLDIVYEDIELDSSGAFDLSTLVIAPYRGKLLLDGVFVQGDGYPNQPKGKFARLISFSERRAHDNKQLNRLNDDPVWYRVSSKIYVDPFDTGDKINLHYMKQPDLMVLDTDDEGHNVDCEFGEELQDILIEYAAYWGLKYVLKDDARAQEALNMALAGIASLNDGEAPTDSTRNQTDFIQVDQYDEIDFPIVMNPISGT